MATMAQQTSAPGIVPTIPRWNVSIEINPPGAVVDAGSSTGRSQQGAEARPDR